MPEDSADQPSVGQRIRHHREHAGMSRPVLAGLVGRSTEWLKAVETGRILTPRLSMLLALADKLHVDLADLTGLPISAATGPRNAHPALPAVSAALQDYSIGDGEPISVEQLEGQVRQAWTLWHGASRQRTAVAVVLPDLIRTARRAARLLDGDERRRALATSAQVCHLTQLFLCYQGVPELVWVVGDRAMTAAQDSGDPRTLAAAAWYMNHVFRDQGEANAARVELSSHAAAMLQPDRGGEDLALWGLQQLAIALSHAKIGHAGDAWRAWDEASRAARALGEGYSHPWLIFGPSMVDAYAITMHVDLFAAGEAVRAADRLDLTAMPSATRRSFHLAEMARAYNLRREPLATVHLLRQAAEESIDTARFSAFARQAVVDLRDRGGATVRTAASRLAEELGVPA